MTDRDEYPETDWEMAYLDLEERAGQTIESKDREIAILRENMLDMRNKDECSGCGQSGMGHHACTGKSTYAGLQWEMSSTKIGAENRKNNEKFMPKIKK